MNAKRSIPEADLAVLSRRYRNALVAYFMRQLHDAALAEDLAQDVFARLATLAERGEIVNIEGYVFRIAKNLVRDSKRRSGVRLGYARAQLNERHAEFDTKDAERVVIARETLSQVTKVLDRLPERTRSIFVLYRLEGLSRKDIAEAYGISVSAVEKHLGKVMASLMNDRGDG